MKRTLKIEEAIRETKYHRESVVPKVRLSGKWLQAAGFKPGAHLELTVISRGVIELRVCEPVPASSPETLRVMAALDRATEGAS